MKWTTATLRELARDRCADARAIERLCNSDKFIEYTKKAENVEKLSYVAFLITSHNTAKLRDLLAPERELEDMNYRQLRDLARKLRVKYYSRLPKEELLREIYRMHRHATNH